MAAPLLGKKYVAHAVEPVARAVEGDRTAYSSTQT